MSATLSPITPFAASAALPAISPVTAENGHFQAAKLLYALLLDHTTLFRKDGWQDDKGSACIVYPLAEVAESVANTMQIKRRKEKQNPDETVGAVNKCCENTRFLL